MNQPLNLQLQSKLPHVGTTIFTVMSALAIEHGAVNLGQGFPDFNCDPQLLQYMQDAMAAGHNQYPPMAGILQLREAVAEKLSSLYGAQYSANTEITITAGATQALQTALTAIVHPGDEVIIFEPVYDSYDPIIRLCGGVPVYARLHYPDYRPNFTELAALITPRTRAIMINSPHNPTATVWSAADMRALEALLAPTNIILISDEVYEHMVFDGARHESVARYPRLAERAFIVSSFGKTYHVTGWKVAYCAAPQALMAEFRKVHQFVVFTVHTPSQHALAAFMQHGSHLQLSAFYQAKRDYFLTQVLQNSGQNLRWHASAGSYFVSASFGHASNLSSQDFAQKLVREVGVACIPISAFYHDAHDDKIVRFCFAKKEETLARAATLLRNLS
jgi:methionine transaminase